MDVRAYLLQVYLKMALHLQQTLSMITLSIIVTINRLYILKKIIYISLIPFNSSKKTNKSEIREINIYIIKIKGDFNIWLF